MSKLCKFSGGGGGGSYGSGGGGSSFLANLTTYSSSQSGTTSTNVCNGQSSPYYNSSSCGSGGLIRSNGQNGYIVITVQISPSISPNSSPSSSPSLPSSLGPTVSPSIVPSYSPTKLPSTAPTLRPSLSPTLQTPSPTSPPTYLFTSVPVISPSNVPSNILTFLPSSIEPTFCPTFVPTGPSQVPSCCPSNPSSIPTSRPTRLPTSVPSLTPTYSPSAAPTFSPSFNPTDDPNCPVGTFYIQFSTYYQCVPCSLGYYSAAANASACEACPLNTYSENNGAVSCSSCPPGYVSSTLASTSRSNCVNPAVNFVFGILSLALCFMAVSIYIIFGRLQRIAFERRRWLIEKNMIIYSMLLKLIDMSKSLCQAVTFMRSMRRRKVEDAILRRRPRNAHYVVVKVKRMLKLCFFLLMSVLAGVVVFVGTLFSVTVHVLFNATLLYRGYRAYFNLNSSSYSFNDRVNDFLGGIGVVLNLSSLVNSLINPINYILDILSFDLNSIKVECSGSQAPINLLLDCFIACIVIISIHSDADLLWMARVRESASQLSTFFPSRLHLFGRFSSTLSALLQSAVSIVIITLPSPMKINQYLISYVSVSEFFSSNGRSQSSPNCDAALSFPIDTIEAILTTVLATIMFPPIIYLFAQVLFPAPISTAKKASHDPAAVSTAGSKRGEIFWRSITAWTSLDWFFMKLIFNLAKKQLQILQALISSINKYFGNEEVLSTFHQFIHDPLQGAALPEVVWLYVLEYLEPQSEAEFHIEEIKWIEQQEQFPSYYTVVQQIADDVVESVDPNNVVASIWSRMYKLFSCWIVPLQIINSAAGRLLWWKVLASYVMYFLMSIGFWVDYMKNQLSVIEKYRTFEAAVLSEVNDLDTVKITENPLFQRDIRDFTSIVVDNVVRRSTIVQDKNVVINYDFIRKTMFLQFLSATTSCRSVMWQLIPGMTGFAIICVETSACPGFIFVDQIREYLPPLIVRDPWNEAENRLRYMKAFRNQNLKDWQVCMMACVVWIQGSRMVQYAIATIYHEYYNLLYRFQYGRLDRCGLYISRYRTMQKLYAIRALLY